MFTSAQAYAATFEGVLAGYSLDQVASERLLNSYGESVLAVAESPRLKERMEKWTASFIAEREKDIVGTLGPNSDQLTVNLLYAAWTW